QESGETEHEEARVKLFAAIALREGAKFGVEPLGADIVVDLLAQAAPMLERPDKTEFLDAPDAAIEGYPSHDFRISEVPRRSANLPYAFVWQLPNPLKMSQQFALQHPIGRIAHETPLAGLVKGVENLAINI